MVPFIDMLPEANLLMFDFRGHGESSGNFITIGCQEYQDVIAAARYMRKFLLGSNEDRLPLVLLGVSMGAAAILKAVAENSSICDALIVDSSYADLEETITRAFTEHSGLPRYPFLPAIKILFEAMTTASVAKMRPVDFVTQISLPIFFIHSSSDLHTPPNDTLRLYVAAKSKQTKLWMGPKTKHATLFSVYFGTYQRKIRVFLDRFIFRTLPSVPSDQRWIPLP